MKSKGKVKAVVGLLALTLVMGSLAYFSKVMSIDNPGERIVSNRCDERRQ